MAAREVPIAMAMALGIGTLLYLNKFNTSLETYFKGLSDVCFTDLSRPNPDRPSFYSFGIPVVDHMHCLLTPFFKDSLDSLAGVLVTRQLMGLYVVVSVLCAVEGLRPKASGFVAAYPAVAALSALVGVSVIFPWAFLASYWWRAFPRLYPPDPTAPYTPSEPHPNKVVAVAVAFLGVMLPWSMAVAWPVPDVALMEFVLALSVPLPVAVAVIWRLTPGRAGSTNGLGHRRVINMCYLLAGAGYIAHLWSLLPLVYPGFPAKDLLPLMAGTGHNGPPAHFLFIDAAVLWMACMWLVALEPVPGGPLQFLLLSVLLGPGAALALFMARREKVLAANDRRAAGVVKQE